MNPPSDPRPEVAPADEAVPSVAPRTLLALAPDELARVFVELGAKPFHARIARENVLAKGLLEYAAMTSLPASLRADLERELPIFAGREIGCSSAPDRTTKLLIEFPRANAREVSVEVVHMPSLALAAEDDETERNGATLCVSTQAGCPIGCPFCASGQLGLARNLAAHEILEQYVRGQSLGRLARSVVMGMGEPLLNFANLSAALDAVHDEMGLGSRRVTVSTVGFPERLRKIAPSRPRFQLAISLHTPDQEQRDELVPAMRGTPIDEVLAAGDDWFEKTGREVTYEYVLLAGTNDTQGHARRVSARLRGRRCTVNLIPYNPVEESPYRRPEGQAVEGFRRVLLEERVVATVRWSRGVDSDAACGQLRLRRERSR
ncbi:MAG: 23S rRNA (adenine(2503)-C(2))-methyltransferase RlmN [Planctomycetota bacterium]|nr:23S rRNA (adenine(2503)-C(2))-methyltransferase RlmN [Planctomycetota bacterium]